MKSNLTLQAPSNIVLAVAPETLSGHSPDWQGKSKTSNIPKAKRRSLDCTRVTGKLYLQGQEKAVHAEKWLFVIACAVSVYEYVFRGVIFCCISQLDDFCM